MLERTEYMSKRHNVSPPLNLKWFQPNFKAPRSTIPFGSCDNVLFGCRKYAGNGRNRTPKSRSQFRQLPTYTGWKVVIAVEMAYCDYLQPCSICLPKVALSGWGEVTVIIDVFDEVLAVYSSG
jgi:hypothetical protein